MALPVWIRLTSMLVAVASVSHGQIFPFSNLKNFFEQRSRTLQGGSGTLEPPTPFFHPESDSDLQPADVGPGALLPTPLPTPAASTTSTRFPYFSGPFSYFEEATPRPDSPPLQPIGGLRFGNPETDAPGEKRPAGGKRPPAGEQRPAGETPRLAAERRPSEERSRLAGEKRPSGEKPRLAGEKRPAGETPRLAADRRPSGEKPRLTGEKRPAGEKRLAGEKRPIAENPRLTGQKRPTGEKRPNAENPRLAGEKRLTGEKPRLAGEIKRPTREKHPAGEKWLPGWKHPSQGPPLHIPLSISFDGPSDNSLGEEPPHNLVPLAPYLTPPPGRAPVANPPLFSLTDAFPAESTNSDLLDPVPLGPLPRFPDFYLRPPSANADMTFFKYPDEDLMENAVAPSRPATASGKLELSDVAQAAVSASKNPAIAAKRPRAPVHTVERLPANHKLPSQFSGNALDGPVLQGDAGKPVRVHKGKGGPSNHRPEADGEPGPGHDHKDSDSETPAESTPVRHRTRPTPPPPPPPQQHHANHKPQPPPPRKSAIGKQPAVRDHLHEGESVQRPQYRKKSPHSNHQPYRPLELEVAESGLHSAGVPHSSDGERVEFQMHGLEGPKSYKFGYDTGKGHNRQFRYEERDQHGHVKGHYGYVDQHGKLQIVNYKADPHGGYSADVSKLHVR